MKNKQSIVTALLSYGMSGEVFHAPLLEAHAGFRMKTILERTSNRAKQHYPDVSIVRSIEEILQDDEIELVVVNTINDTHVEFAQRALDAGKHVIVEKPFTPTFREAEDLISFSRQKGKMLSVFQSRRWDGAFLTLNKIIAGGYLGKIVEYEAHYDRFRNYVVSNSWKEEPAPGSGILYNLGSHMIDQVLILFGMPASVTALMGAQRPGGRVDDFYDLRLGYPGINVIVKSSYLVREPGPLYRVNGVNGSFVKFGIDPQEEAHKLHQIPGGAGWGSEPEKYWGKLNTQIADLHFEGSIETLAGNYSGYYDNIYEVIRHGKTLAVKAEEAAQVIRVIEAAIESNRDHKTIVLE